MSSLMSSSLNFPASKKRERGGGEKRVGLQGGRNRNGDFASRHSPMIGPLQTGSQGWEESGTYPGLQSLVTEVGHRVLFAAHHGHFNHRVFVEER